MSMEGQRVSCMSRSTYGEMAARTPQLAEIWICPAHDGLVHLDLGTIAEFDGQV